MKRLRLRRSVYAAVGWTVRALVCLETLALLPGCATTPPPNKDDVIMIDTVPGDSTGGNDPVVTTPRAPGAARTPDIVLPPPPPVLAEKLEPVRGGDQMLPPYRGHDPCKMALTGKSPVARACSEGGTKKALELMQRFVRRAKTQGMVFQCVDCHPDDDDYSKLAPGADDEFRKLLFLSRPAD